MQVFNGSPIRGKERTDAEQMYLKRILHELAAVGDSKDQHANILVCHPRYSQLCERYPEVVASATAALRGGSGGPSTLGSSLIQVKIVPMSMNSTTFDPLAKRMPQNMKISQLKIFIEKKFGVPTTEQLLSFRADSRVRNTFSFSAASDSDVRSTGLSFYRPCHLRLIMTTVS
jgi:tubulin-specific chaperone E